MTKALLVISFLAVFAFLKNRLSPYPEANTGIQFFNGTWQEALKKSAKEKKPIFLDIYASWCGPCKKLKRDTFTNEEAGKFFNEHFINMELDGERGEGRLLAQQYGVRAYPSLFVIANDEEVLLYSTGYHSASDLVQFGQEALKNIHDGN